MSVKKEHRDAAVQQAKYGNYWAQKFMQAYDELAEMKQAAWAAYATMGFDTDGDDNPNAVGDLPGLLRRSAEEFRKDYDDLLDELAL